MTLLLLLLLLLILLYLLVKRKKTEGMCIAIGCYNRSCYNEERGYQYCSNDCIINHYK